MSASTDAQRLIAVSLGKIAVSRQQRGGINLYKNLLVASVLHKARTTYMMDNFQTLLAQKRAQAEKEAAAKMVVDTRPEMRSSRVELMESSTTPGVTDRIRSDKAEAPNGEQIHKASKSCSDKENIVPVCKNNGEFNSSDNCDKSVDFQSKCCRKDSSGTAPIVLGKTALSSRNSSDDYVSQLPQCRCVGTKRRRSDVETDSVTASKRARFTDESEGSDSEFEYDSDSSDSGDCDSMEKMQTESSQVTGLVDIFNNGFNGLCRNNDAKQQNATGHINVYVSADRPVSGHQYMLKDISCGTQIKDKVSLPTAIALAV